VKNHYADALSTRVGCKGGAVANFFAGVLPAASKTAALTRISEGRGWQVALRLAGRVGVAVMGWMQTSSVPP
jgi:hypothetical protein